MVIIGLFFWGRGEWGGFDNSAFGCYGGKWYFEVGIRVLASMKNKKRVIGK